MVKHFAVPNDFAQCLANDFDSISRLLHLPYRLFSLCQAAWRIKLSAGGTQIGVQFPGLVI